MTKKAEPTLTFSNQDPPPHAGEETLTKRPLRDGTQRWGLHLPLKHTGGIGATHGGMAIMHPLLLKVEQTVASRSAIVSWMSFPPAMLPHVVATVLGNCQKQPIESCVTTDYLVAVSSYTRDLETAVAAKNCSNEPIARADVADYVAKITPLFVNEDAAALTTGVTAAFDDCPWPGQSPVPRGRPVRPVFPGTDMKTKFYCPADRFAFWYNWQCPKQ